jgi:hypothetical protein
MSLIRRLVIPCMCLLSLAAPLRAQTLQAVDADHLRQQSITTIGGPVGDLLRQWWKEGTAAGNIGDYYDNRDGDHSPLNLGQFPQLLAVKYSADDIKVRKHWAAQHVIHPAVVFGNSSTSAPPTQGGSNPRSYYLATRGLGFLAEEYAKNNLYIYPEHRDHDPGHNGKGDGFGDLYPTNTPYLLISQGSSGSDQPFMRAVPVTLAAFRPDVKKKLAEEGALMPALQMILRKTNKHLKAPDEYRTGKAHPSVFEGSWLDDLAMSKLAHAMELKALPPVVRLKVVEEDPPPRPGVDYFEAGVTEKLADTPAVIARIHRSKDRTRRLVVSAEESRDLNRARLSYTWTVLRGDPERITIKPRNQDGSMADITVAYHERRPIAPGSPMESNRVDIGVFADNGTYTSAPAFITIYTLDSESRSYDANGRLVEIGYNMGETDLRITDWARVLNLLVNEGGTAGKLFGIDALRRRALADLARRHDDLTRKQREAQEKVKAAEAREKTAEDAKVARKETDAARKEATQLQQQVTAVLDEMQPALGTSVRRFVEDSAYRLARAPDFLMTKLTPDQPPPAALLKQVQNLGVNRPDSKHSSYDRAQLEHINMTALVQYALPGAAQVSYQPNFVDQRLTAPRFWRDVYQYDTRGQCTGWTRYHSDRAAEEFNHEGLLVVEKDELGRCKKGRTARYTRAAAKSPLNTNPLRMELGDEYITYAFAGPDDRCGKRSGSESVK